MTEQTEQEIPSAPTDPFLRAGASDNLNELIGVLTRREVEARLLAPLVDALTSEFGREPVLRILRDTVVDISRQQGAQLVDAMGGDSLQAFADSLRFWTQDGALEIEVIAQDDDTFSFNVTRCRYAELYRDLGIPELGALLSCNRDYALIEGFNPGVSLTRSQTIMEGASFCDFRYQRRTEPIELELD